MAAKRPRRRSPRRPRRPPKRLTAYQRQQAAEASRRALHAVARSRATGTPVSRAAKQEHTTLRTVAKHAAGLVSRTESGRLAVTPYDRMRRPMRVLTPDGVLIVDVRDSRSASQLGRYWNAVDSALRGDPTMLGEFQGKRLRIGPHSFPYVTDHNQLRRLAQVGEVSFEDLYDTTR